MIIKKEWSIGGDIIVASSVLALLSMFMKWVDISLLAQNGFQQKTLFYLIFFVYPLYIALKNSKINRTIAYISSGLAIFFGVGYITSKSSHFFGNVSSTGAYLYSIAAFTLLVGVYNYKSRKVNIRDD
ncbi:MAG: hypothetical protein Q8942_07920 [Bacillota bacterium]|nr:hypothetical protein [Bacillota bacterium]